MNIFIVDNFLDDTDLIQYRDFVKSRSNHTIQKVIANSQLAEEFWFKYGKKIVELDPTCTGVFSSITVTHTETPIQLHVDSNRHNEYYKILIYLNSVSNGGTIFYPNDKIKLVENRQNRLVMFDMRIPHESQNFQIQDQKIKKIAIGFRVGVQS